MQELLIGRHNLKNELSEREGQLKALVSHSAEPFSHSQALKSAACVALLASMLGHLCTV